ncbi:MAG: phage holin family protein [Allosphingosinicella sp.]
MIDRPTRDPTTGGAMGEAGDDTFVRTPRADSPAAERSAFAFRERESAAPRHDARHGASDESIPELLRRLTDQGSHLAQQQAKLVEAEVRSSVNDLKEAAGAMAGAGVVAIAGLGVLLMGLSFLLGEAMDLWLATLIVAAATLAGAYAMFAAGRKKLQASALDAERTRRTLERAPGAISGHEEKGRRNGR